MALASHLKSLNTDSFSQIMSQIQAEYNQAKQANEKRRQQAMAIYDEIVNRYQSGGEFGKAALAQLEAQKERDIGKETQAQISAGLFGTTAQTGLGTKWEAEVGAPARLKLEDIMMERLSQAQLGKAGFIERQEDEYPDVSAAAQAAAQGAGTQTIVGQADISSYMQRFNESRGGSVSGGGPTGSGTTGGNIPRVTTPQGPTTDYGGGDTGIGRTTQRILGGMLLGGNKKKKEKFYSKVVVGKRPGGGYIYGIRGPGNV